MPAHAPGILRRSAKGQDLVGGCDQRHSLQATNAPEAESKVEGRAFSSGNKTSPQNQRIVSSNQRPTQPRCFQLGGHQYSGMCQRAMTVKQARGPAPSSRPFWFVTSQTTTCARQLASSFLGTPFVRTLESVQDAQLARAPDLQRRAKNDYEGPPT